MKKIITILLLLLIGTASAGWYPSPKDVNTSGDVNGVNGAFSGDVNIVGALTTGTGPIASGVYDSDWRLAANHSFYSTAGTGKIDFSNVTGTNVFNDTDFINDVDIDNTLQVGGDADMDDVDINNSLDVDNAANVGGAFKADSITSNSTAGIHGGVSADSYGYFGGALRGASIKTNSSLVVETNTVMDGYLQVGGTVYTNGVVVNSTKTLTVTDADKLTVGGVIVPQEIVLTVPLTKTDFAAGELNRSIFIADDAWTITSIEEVHNVAESTATTLVLSVQKLTGTQALNAGINITNGNINLKGTANTVQAATLSTTTGRTTLADGNRIGILCNLTGTNAMSEFRGGVLTIHMKRV